MPIGRFSRARYLPPQYPARRWSRPSVTVTIAPEYLGDYALEADSIASTATVGTPALSVPPQNLTAASITATPTVGATTLAVGAVALTAASITATPTVGATSLAVSSRDLVAASITSSPTVGTASLTVGALALSAASITATSSMGAAALSQSSPAAPQNLTAGSIILTSMVPSPYLIIEARTIATVSVSRAEAAADVGRHDATTTTIRATGTHSRDRAVAQLVD